MSIDLDKPIEKKSLFEPDPDFNETVWQVRWHRSCTEISKAQRFTDLRQSLRNERFDVDVLYPLQGRVLDWNRYFKHPQGVYLQLSANWQGDHPETYLIAMSMSDDASFSTRVSQKESPSIPSGAVTWPEAQKALEKITKELDAEGYIVGRRSVVLASSGSRGGDAAERSRVESLGPLPRVLQLGRTFCVPKGGYLCYCDSESTPGPD